MEITAHLALGAFAAIVLLITIICILVAAGVLAILGLLVDAALSAINTIAHHSD